VTEQAGPHFRLARPADAEAVARLHAESWRRHYRGAYADAFLDGDVLADRLATWRERLHEPSPCRRTILAVDNSLIGFANTYLDDDPRWGSLLDNLHVAATHQRRGIGSRLLALTAAAIAERGPEPDLRLYVWVLAQNTDARSFYEAHGAVPAGRAPVTPPGGVPGRLRGSPLKLRCAWRDITALARGAR
jgi:GNAT superfamily N-acetyltransferase